MIVKETAMYFTVRREAYRHNIQALLSAYVNYNVPQTLRRC